MAEFDIELVVLPKGIRDAPSIWDAIWDVFDSIKDWIADKLRDFYNEYIQPALDGVKSAIISGVRLIVDPIKNTVNSIWNTITSIADRLWDIIRTPLEWIRNAIHTLASWILNGLRTLGDYLGNVLGNVINGLRTAIHNALASLRQGILTLANWIKGGIITLGNKIWQVLSSVGNTIYKGLQWTWNIINRIGNTIGNIFRSIGEKIFQGISWIRDTIHNLIANITSGFRLLWEKLHHLGHSVKEVFEKIFGVIRDFFRDPIGTLWKGIQKYLIPALSWIVDKAKSFAVWIGDKIKGVLETLWHGLTTLLSGFVNFITNTVIKPVFDRLAGRGGSPGWVDILTLNTQLIGAAITAAFRSMIEYAPPATYDKAWAAAQKFVGLSFSMGVLMAISDLIEDLVNRIIGIKIAGTGLGDGGRRGPSFLTRIIQTVYWSIGIGWLTWMTFGPVLRATIGQPLYEYYQEKYRPEMPTRSMVEEWLRLRLITQDDAKKLLAKLGYKDEYITKILVSAWKIPALGYVEDMLMLGLIDDAKALDFIRKLGYDDSTAVFMLTLMKFRAVKEQRGKYFNNIYKKYKYGMMSKEEALSALTQAGMPRILAEWWIKAADIEKEIETYDEYIKGTIDLFVKGYIDEQELREELSKWIKDAEMIDAIIFRANARRMPKIRLPPLETLEKRYRRALVQVKSYEAQLRRMTRLRKETEDVYRVRIEMLEAQRRAIEEYYDTLIETLKKEVEEEFKAYEKRKTEEVKARAEFLRKVLEVKLKAKKEVLEAYELRRREELEARLKEYEVRLNDIKRRLEAELAKPPEQQNKYLIEKLTLQAERLLARIDALRIMTEARIEERRRKVEEDMAKEAEVISAKIELLEKMAEVAIEYRRDILRATLERRVKRLEAMKKMRLTAFDYRIRLLKEEMERTLANYDERIAYLKVRYEYYLNELEAIKATIAKYYPEYAEKLGM